MDRSQEAQSAMNVLDRVEDYDLHNDIELPVFSESPAVTIQPQIGGDFPGSRRPIPVWTTDWRSTNLSMFSPMHGLDFLIGADQLNIQQTVELNDLFANVESENRYTVKIPQGETLYLACETSTATQRMCFGSRRAFSMKLYDPTRQEALSFHRRLACNNFLCGCYLQELQVWIPPGEMLGRIKQDLSVIAPTFTVLNKNQEMIYKIEGPTLCACSCYKDAHFKVFSPDGLTQVGSIHHQWDQLMVGYNLCLTFPARNTPSDEKALLLGSAFLLEYMFFEQAKNSRWRCCV